MGTMNASLPVGDGMKVDAIMLGLPHCGDRYSGVRLGAGWSKKPESHRSIHSMYG